VVEETSKDSDYSAFREKLLNAKSKDKKGKEGMGGRYAVYDVQYDLESGEGTRNKITFISWCPDDAPQYVSSTWNFPRFDKINHEVASHDVFIVERSPEACAKWPCC
jgi:hypothetical protein